MALQWILYIYIHTCTYIHMYLQAYIYTFMYLFMYFYISIYRYIYIYTHIYILHTYTMCICTCINIFLTYVTPIYRALRGLQLAWADPTARRASGLRVLRLTITAKKLEQEASLLVCRRSVILGCKLSGESWSNFRASAAES